MIGSLCSGIGALELACAELFGMNVAWQSEIDPHAASVLATRFPDVTQLGDLLAVDFRSVEPVELMCFGFPCTDISTAGKGAGIAEGTRSGLFFDCWRAVRVVRPRFVVMENVPAILTRRPGIDVVADAMAGDGYEFRWVCVRASDIGACHRRKRWFCVAVDPDQGGWGRWGKVYPWDAGDRQGRERWFTRTGAGTVADAENAERQQPQQPQQPTVPEATRPATEFGERYRSSDFDWRQYERAVRRHEVVLGRPAPHPVDGEGRLSSRFVEWMMMYPDGWVSSLLPRNDALRCLGNSVVRRQAVSALRFLLGYETSHTHTHTHTHTVAAFADADSEGLEGHRPEPVELARQLPTPTSSELSLSLSLSYLHPE